MTTDTKLTPLHQLQECLGYRFKNSELLSQSLTHASMTSDPTASNERLEFLGDRVLGLLISDALIKLYPNTNEGGLAPRLNELVRRETCAAVAQEINLGSALILAASESGAGGRQKTAILADACEALIGALYLDGGLDAARTFVDLFWADRLANLTKTPQDAKTALQEWSQGQGLSLPRYEITARSGPDHQPVFVVQVDVEGFKPEEGQGPSKRVAEQVAAAALLTREGIWPAQDAPS